MRDCEFSEYMLERLYMKAVNEIDEDEELDEDEDEDENEQYDWRNDPTPATLDEELDEEIKPFYSKFTEGENVFFRDEHGVKLSLDEVAERML